jgi:amino acid adenylation domain-containing protein
VAIDDPLHGGQTDAGTGEVPFGVQALERSEEPADVVHDLCYVYFTSGSTGDPKGVAGRIGAIGHFVRWEIGALGLNVGTRVTQLTSPGFDAFLRDMFVPLCVGGTVCVPPSRQISLGASDLVKWLDAAQVDVIHCVPTVLRTLFREALVPTLFASTKYVLLAGEAVYPSDVKRWYGVFGDRIQLVNLYGPTETTMVKCAYRILPSDQDRRSIPIGKAIEGSEAFLLDELGHPSPAGVVGEIYIRTPDRALGYYGRPDLTSEVFVANPLSNDVHDIVYRTGDLGRVLEDGNLEFVGRRDQQVKIRGVRVELAEVEGVLRRHASVADVAVVDRDGPDGTRGLCAYVVPQGTVRGDEIRSFALEELPEPMVPGTVVLVDALPRTPNGKVDRQSLLSVQIADRLANFYEAPRNELERDLSEVWSKVLGLPRIGINDNFFDLGGHSLLFVRMLSMLRNEIGVELPLQTLFEAPTIAQLARTIEASAAHDLREG